MIATFQEPLPSFWHMLPALPTCFTPKLRMPSGPYLVPIWVPVRNVFFSLLQASDFWHTISICSGGLALPFFLHEFYAMDAWGYTIRGCCWATDPHAVLPLSVMRVWCVCGFSFSFFFFFFGIPPPPPRRWPHGTCYLIV